MKRLSIKKEFPVFLNERYFNFGSSGPVAMTVIKKMYSHLLLQAKEGSSSPGFMRRYLSDYVKLKGLLSRFLNVCREEIAITQNTTEGINIVLRGLSWKPDDEIITTELEHSGLKVPLEKLKMDYSVKIRILKTVKLSQSDLLKELKNKINPKVKMIALSHVDYITGRCLPIKKISVLSKKHRILLLVDGAQAIGSIPVDLKKLRCDFYSFPSYKWLLGPRTIGCLFVKKKCIKIVSPIFSGWCSVNDISIRAIVNVHGIKRENPSFNFVNSAGKYALSTWSTVIVAGFLESLLIFRKYFEKKLNSNMSSILIFKRELLRIPGIIMLTPMPKEDSAGIISFKFKKRSSFEIARRLIYSNVLIRYVPEMDCIRCCVSVINDDSDLKFFISRLKQIIV
ncbi:MAG: aminotransferase class V-fold PLP-dependent enzyme [Candidatus Omnitrophica bacterium]|nr:aminotransferase class V-fold PLP-dependent enzyme [Candidatus Omnitrophota bacterium]